VSSTDIAGCAKGTTGSCGSTNALTGSSGSTCSEGVDSENMRLCPCSPRWISPVTRWTSCTPLARRKSSLVLPLLLLTKCREA